jgi:hypothetical protein
MRGSNQGTIRSQAPRSLDYWVIPTIHSDGRRKWTELPVLRGILCQPPQSEAWVTKRMIRNFSTSHTYF